MPYDSVVPFNQSQVNGATQSNNPMVITNNDRTDTGNGTCLQITDDDVFPSPLKKLCSALSPKNPLTPSDVNNMETTQENDV